MAIQNPFFLCIGAQKAGTTWLYKNLKAHRDVHLTPFKEIHYFDEIDKNEKISLLHRITAKDGISHWFWQVKIASSFRRVLTNKNLSELAWFTRYFFFKRNFHWYQKLFDCPQDKISGDITPDYCILGQKTIELIRKNLPHLKIIYIIRNPVDRAWSALRMRYVKRRGYAIDDINESILDEYYLKFNKFNDIPRTMTNWSGIFGEDQFQVFFYDELVDSPLLFYRKILDYLKLETIRADAPENHLIGKWVHTGIKADIPLELRKDLCRRNLDQLTILADWFKGNEAKYPQKWLENAKKAIG